MCSPCPVGKVLYVEMVCHFKCLSLYLQGALIGLGVGTNADAANDWLLALAAGGFCYIALSQMLPEVVKSCHKVWEICLALFACTVGFLAMFFLSAYEPHADC